MRTKNEHVAAYLAEALQNAISASEINGKRHSVHRLTDEDLQKRAERVGLSEKEARRQTAKLIKAQAVVSAIFVHCSEHGLALVSDMLGGVHVVGDGHISGRFREHVAEYSFEIRNVEITGVIEFENEALEGDRLAAIVEAHEALEAFKGERK